MATGGAGEVAERVVEQLDATQGLAIVREQDGEALTADQVAQLVADGEYPVGVVFPEGTNDTPGRSAHPPGRAGTAAGGRGSLWTRRPQGR